MYACGLGSYVQHSKKTRNGVEGRVGRLWVGFVGAGPQCTLDATRILLAQGREGCPGIVRTHLKRVCGKPADSLQRAERSGMFRRWIVNYMLK